jgi:hypothetical protein
LKAEDVRARRMPQSALLRISPPGSRHLRGLTFTDAAWEQASKSGTACHLFYPSSDRLGVAAQMA